MNWVDASENNVIINDGRERGMKHTEGKGLEICPPASFEIGPVWHQGQEMRHKQGRRQLKCWRDNLWILNGGGGKNCFYFLNSLKKLFLLLRTVCVVRIKWNARGGKNDPWGSPNVNFGRQKTGFSFLKKCSWCLLQKKQVCRQKEGKTMPVMGCWATSMQSSVIATLPGLSVSRDTTELRTFRQRFSHPPTEIKISESD